MRRAIRSLLLLTVSLAVVEISLAPPLAAQTGGQKVAVENEAAEAGESVAARGAAELWRWIVEAWNHELISVDERPITVGKVIASVVLLLFAYMASRFLSRILGKSLLPRAGLNTSAAAALQSVAFYVLIATFTLLALQLVNVPLTVFTFLGGAVAIGVGFGSQNVVNNFISGLILLAERPIRVGDLIQLGELHGTVEHIGARSTRVRSTTNLEIIVPNSSFLENNVVNLTLSDNRIRARVNVGVAYGSPTREVSRLLLRAAREHGLILKKPEPFVWFTDFADNSLNFELHFWIRLRKLAERFRIESDIRHRIDHLLREARISIPFPQRDVHLDQADVLEVRLVEPQPHQTKAKAA